jgi:excisionase family DNA binding protein
VTFVATDGTKRAQNGRRPSPAEAIQLTRVEGADGHPPTWPGPTSPLLTTSQAAEYLQVSVRAAKNLLSAGSIAYVKIGRATRIHRDDIDEFIAHNRRRERYGMRAS